VRPDNKVARMRISLVQANTCYLLQVTPEQKCQQIGRLLGIRVEKFTQAIALNPVGHKNITATEFRLKHWHSNAGRMWNTCKPLQVVGFIAKIHFHCRHFQQLLCYLWKIQLPEKGSDQLSHEPEHPRILL